MWHVAFAFKKRVFPGATNSRWWVGVGASCISLLDQFGSVPICDLGQGISAFRVFQIGCSVTAEQLWQSPQAGPWCNVTGLRTEQQESWLLAEVFVGKCVCASWKYAEFSLLKRGWETATVRGYPRTRVSRWGFVSIKTPAVMIFHDFFCLSSI